jgi:hypothetical protein
MSDTAIPNFLIIGGAKSGTTSLWNYLKQHPQIYLLPEKEPRFFAYEGKPIWYIGPGDEKWNRPDPWRWSEYQQSFRPSLSQVAVGEASNVYLYFAERAAARIAAYIPRVKLIAFFRDPVARAYSHFLMLRGEGREAVGDFRKALQLEKSRLQKGWSPDWAYAGRGFYADAVSEYLKYFPRTQMKFFLYEDFVQKPAALFEEIFNFLEVENFLPDTSRRYNVSTWPRIRLFAFILHNRNPVSRMIRPFLPAGWRLSLNKTLRKWNAKRPPGLDPQLRAELLSIYAEDIARTSELIGRDLSHWLLPDGPTGLRKEANRGAAK